MEPQGNASKEMIDANYIKLLMRALTSAPYPRHYRYKPSTNKGVFASMPRNKTS